jgi:transposase
MNNKELHRHDIDDRTWGLLEPLLPGQKGGHGRVAKDNRLFINAVLHILRTGSPWRDLPCSYGGWNNTHRRFSRWRDKCVWSRLLEVLTQDVDFEWLMIDSSHVKVHPHAAGAVGGNQDMGITKGGLNSKIHLAVDAHGMPVRAMITSGTVADCTQAVELIKGFKADHLLADKGYDSNDIIEQAKSQGMNVQIPPKKTVKNKESMTKISTNTDI